MALRIFVVAVLAYFITIWIIKKSCDSKCETTNKDETNMLMCQTGCVESFGSMAGYGGVIIFIIFILAITFVATSTSK